jgi:transketolase
MRKTCLDALVDLARRDERVVLISTDAGAKSLRDFKSDHPWRCYLEGANEQHLVGMAAGLARDGCIVYAHADALARRAYEQIAVDVCHAGVNVRLVGGAGAPAADFALMRALPGMVVLAPADAAEAGRMMHATVDWQGPVYVRLAGGGEPAVTMEHDPFVIGKAVPKREGNDALLLTTGTGLHASLAAADLLEGHGVRTAVLHLPTIKPLDEQAVRSAVNRVAAVVTVEDHSIVGGLGSAVAELLAESELLAGRRFQRIGLPDAVGDRHGVSPEDVASVVLAMLDQDRPGSRHNQNTRAA